MKIAFLVSLLFILVIYSIYLFTGYKSAFEADQQCHYLLNTEYSNTSDYGCDHDLETRQWLLFKIGENKNPSSVIKRFRY